MFAIEVQIRKARKNQPAVWETRAYDSTVEQAWKIAIETAKKGKPVRVVNERGALMENPNQELTGTVKAA